MRFATVAPFVLTALLAPSLVSAQWTERRPTVGRGAAPRAVLAPGARVRAIVDRSADGPSGSDRRVSGRLLRLDADSLLIDEGDRVAALARRSVSLLELRDGHMPRGRAALRGAGVGGSIGFVSGAVLAWVAYEPCDPAAILCVSRTDEAVVGGAVGGTLGLAIGGVVGAARAGERWRKVPLTGDTRVIATPSRVGLAVRF